MFLITTADQIFWKRDEKILFLGEWCKLFSQRLIWEKLSYEVLPYHWDDRKKLYQDYLYLNNLYEKTIPILSERLNQIHNVKHSLRYWRIIIGPWLNLFVQIFYDRYKSIISAEECGKVSNTLIGRYKEGHWIPQDFPEFSKWFTHDDYNHYLYSRIIEYRNKLPFTIIDVKENKKAFKFNINNKKGLNYLLYLYEKHIPDCLNRIVFVFSYLRIRDLVKLQLSLKQLPYLSFSMPEYSKVKIDLNLREILSLESSDNEFEVLLAKLIKEQIPAIYVEGYRELNEISLHYYPKQPKMILNAVAYYSNEPFKFWAAYHAEQGTKLAGLQYGGHYGSGLYSTTEDHEIKIYDKFYTWGWESESCNNVKPLSAAKLNKMRECVHPKKNGRLLLVTGIVPRYVHMLMSGFVSSTGVLSYFDDQYRFINSLSEENKKLLLIRLYVHDYGWDQKERWVHKFPEVECCLGNKSMLDQLNESRLFIGTYNATTYLEAFAANFPTILYWNPLHWELRPLAQPFFNELRKVGILHDTPESAAKKVNDISNDPMSWWVKNEVQEAKDMFCKQYANTSESWLKEWKNELIALKTG